MDFSHKLDFLMNITRTSNSALSLHTSLDASHISRLRRGERKLPKKANYIRTMAAYFTRQCLEEYQIKALLEALGKPAALLNDLDLTADRIYHWLQDDAPEETMPGGDLPDNRSKIHPENTLCNEDLAQSTKPDQDLPDVSLHYGDEGKRCAVADFLSLVLESDKTGTLLLHSDESMEWLTEDTLFMAKWAELLKQVIVKGNRIRIIHTLNRNLDELLEALAKWMPLYMTGAIEPYYYPKVRDGIFKRTIFLFPGAAALTATSLDTMTDKAVNILVRDLKAVDALTAEFNAYFQLCRPLMRIYTLRDKEQYLSAIESFEKKEANTIIEAEYLSPATLPAAAAASMFARTDSNRKKRLRNYYLTKNELFRNNIAHHQYNEIIRLPETDEIKKGRVELGLTGIDDFAGLYYTTEEYKAHLENIVQLLQTYENYNLILKKRISHEGYTLYVKEDLGAFVFKTSSPNLIFEINENNLTSAFWDYLQANLGKKQRHDKQKRETIKQLQAVISELISEVL